MTTTPQPIDRAAVEEAAVFLNVAANLNSMIDEEKDPSCGARADALAALIDWADEARTFLACAMSGTQPPRGMFVDDLLARWPAKETTCAVRHRACDYPKQEQA